MSAVTRIALSGMPSSWSSCRSRSGVSSRKEGWTVLSSRMWWSTNSEMFSVTLPDPLTIGLSGGADPGSCLLCVLKRQ